MTIKRMDHVSVVVDDLPAAIAFFTALGMALEGQMPVEGPGVDRLCGLEGVQADIAMMRTPDGHGRVELTKYRNPELVEAEPAMAPPGAGSLARLPKGPAAPWVSPPLGELRECHPPGQRDSRKIDRALLQERVSPEC